MLIATDTETGGLKPEINPILSIAFYNQEHEFYIQIQGEKEFCDAKALEINGLDPEKGVTRQEAREQITAWWTSIGQPKLELIGHNLISFDLGFIAQLALPVKIDYHYRDSMIAAALLRDCGKITTKSVSLKACCELFGIEFEAHNALEDAKASWKLYHKCLDIIRG